MTGENQELLVTGRDGKELASRTGSPCPDARSTAAPWRQDTVPQNSIYRWQQGHINKKRSGKHSKRTSKGGSAKQEIFNVYLTLSKLTAISYAWNKPLCAQSLQSHLTLCNPTDWSPPGSSVHAILHQEYWSGLPCPPPRDLLNPGRDQTRISWVSYTAGRFFTAELPGKPKTNIDCSKKFFKKTTQKMNRIALWS